METKSKNIKTNGDFIRERVQKIIFDDNRLAEQLNNICDDNDFMKFFVGNAKLRICNYCNDDVETCEPDCTNAYLKWLKAEAR